MESEDTTDKFGLMPYLSEDGSKNVFILNVNRFYGLNKKLENDPEKLEDALKVMKGAVYGRRNQCPVSGQYIKSRTTSFQRCKGG